MNNLWKFLVDEDGPTAVEYAVMLAAIMIVCIGSIGSVGVLISESYNGSQNSITSAMTSSSS